jgi:hypothetical protein
MIASHCNEAIIEKMTSGGAVTMKSRAAEIHASLKHPVIDGDGHWLEPVPVFLECLRESGGA